MCPSGIVPNMDEEKKQISEEVRAYMRANGRKGGQARRDSMTPEQRSQFARESIRKRWEKKISPQS